MPAHPFPWKKTLLSNNNTPSLRKRASSTSLESTTTTTTLHTPNPTTTPPNLPTPLQPQPSEQTTTTNNYPNLRPKKKPANHPFRLRIDVTNRPPPLSLSVMFRRLSSVFSSTPSNSNSPFEGGPPCLLNHLSHKNAETYLSNMYSQVMQKELARTSTARTKGSPYNTEVAARNMKKNRYQDVLPYEKHRVRIGKVDRPSSPSVQSTEDSNYINASHLVSLDLKTRYIATQGPLPATEGAFWQMVHEQNSRVIVMLAREEENGRIKCHAYWPKRVGERLVLEEQGLEVRLAEEREHSDSECIVRTLGISRRRPPGESGGGEKADGERIVYQIQYPNWPDHGIPTSASTLLKVIKLANSLQAAQRSDEHRANSSGDVGTLSSASSCSSATAAATPATSQPGPMIVHCSAGVGRTGTFCVVDAALSLLHVPGYGIPTQPLNESESSQLLIHSPPSSSPSSSSSSPSSSPSLDKNEDVIHALVERFRQQRTLMVQTPGQFGYCYVAVKEGYLSARRSRSESDPGSGICFHAPT